MTLPTGIVTFLFTDLEGSTRLWETYPEEMKAATSRHDTLLREFIEQHGGFVIKTTGDGFHAVFDSAVKAVEAAFAAQGSIQNEHWEVPEPLTVRMGLHSGEAQLRDGDYYGSSVNRGARLMAVGSGSQVLLSDVTAKLVRESLPEGAVLVDLGEHFLRDLILPEHVYQLNGEGLPTEFPALKTLKVANHNLPDSLTSFVGRERESAEVEQMLKTTRLLTLVGVGGTGKTRLMLHVANSVIYDYPQGIWLVELAALTDPEQVLQQVASTLHLHEIPGRSLQDVLVDYLRYKQTILLLDNCEHLINACARLAQEILGECPKLTILATSREGLGIRGERIYQVPSLSIPTPSEIQADKDLLDYEAIRLFVVRAQAVLPEFQLTPTNSTAIVQICQRLDGIPLAVELAAARVRLLSPEQIATRLRDHFRLLAGGSRSALPRQQTLQSLIDWSWDLLSDSEHKLLSRLSVFSGGWELEAAETIVYLPGESELDVLEGLFSLVNKSLVIAENQAGDGRRYHLLETIRQYARERLMEAGEISQSRQRHADYFARLAIEAGPQWMGKNVLEWFERLDAEYSNIRSALEWNIERQPALALEMVGGIQQYFVQRSLNEEAQYWSEQVFQATLVTLPTLEGEILKKRQALLATVRAWQAMLMIMLGGSHEWIRIGLEALALARQSGDNRALSTSLVILGFVSAFVNKTTEAVTYAEEGLELSRQTGNLFATGVALSVLAMLSGSASNDTDLESRYITELLHWYRSNPNPWLAGITLRNLGQALVMKAQYSEAIPYLEESIRIFEMFKNRHFLNMSRSEIGHAQRKMGNMDKAMEVYSETILAWQELGHRGAVANQLECMGFVAVERDQWERAAKLLGAAEALRVEVDSPRLIYEQMEYDEVTARLKQNIQLDTFKTAWEQGRRMGMGEAVAYALAEVA